LVEKEIRKMTVVVAELLGDEGNEATNSFLGTKVEIFNKRDQFFFCFFYNIANEIRI
jgi:hypothetical protein